MKVLRWHLVWCLINIAMLCNSVAVADPAFDLADLENRLRETDAIGLFTKLSLKAQVDNLVDDFRAFHSGEGSLDIESLRQRYQALLSETLALVEIGDPELYADISRARRALWTVLADELKFASL
ncbi:MAG: hypothetical protein ACREVE_18125 [Gammaproteobacteria bacterium]